MPGREATGGKQGLLAPVAFVPELDVLSPDELLRLNLGLTGVTASGRDLLNGHRAHLRCVGLNTLRHDSSAWIAGSTVSWHEPPTARGFAFFILQDGSEGYRSLSARTSERPTGSCSGMRGRWWCTGRWAGHGSGPGGDAQGRAAPRPATGATQHHARSVPRIRVRPSERVLPRMAFPVVVVRVEQPAAFQRQTAAVDAAAQIVSEPHQ